MFCSKCGKEIADNSKFCPECGDSITKEEPVVDSVQSKARSINRTKYSKVSLKKVYFRNQDNESNNIKIVALVLGIIGGVMGIINGNDAIAFGNLGKIFGVEGSDTISNLGWQSIIFGILGLIGGVCSISKPGLAAILLVSAAILGFIFLSITNVSSILFVIASVLVYIGWSNEQ